MSFLDKIAASIMPAASDEDRAQARAEATRLAHGHDWLAQVLDHHRQIEGLFEAALNASGSQARVAAAKELGALLTAHSAAEEAVLYPAVIEHSGKTSGTMAYEEQAMAKVQLAMLEKLDPMSQEWRDKLEHIQGAVQQHVYQEEHSWFPEVIEATPADERGRLSSRYQEEFTRCNAGKAPTWKGEAAPATAQVV